MAAPPFLFQHLFGSHERGEGGADGRGAAWTQEASQMTIAAIPFKAGTGGTDQEAGAVQRGDGRWKGDGHFRLLCELSDPFIFQPKSVLRVMLSTARCLTSLFTS